jgi:hypothetical protein
MMTHRRICFRLCLAPFALALAACSRGVSTETLPITTHIPATSSVVALAPQITQPTRASVAPTAAPIVPTSEPAQPTEEPQSEPGMGVVAPTVDGRTGFLLGGTQNGRWLDPDATAQLLAGNERYRLYSGVTNLGEARGSRPVTESAGLCSGRHVITLQPSPQVQPAIAIGGSWDPLPRQPEVLSLDSLVYRAAMADWLRTQGIDQPDVRLTSVQRIDLEGDGVDEVLVSATRLKDGGHTPPVAAGDYSVVVIRKLVAGTVVTLPLVGQYYRQAQELAYPSTHTIGTVLDVNGDGTQEIVVHSTFWEGTATTIYAVHDSMVQHVGSVGCHE